MNKKRTLIIGLDGATFDIIKPMVADGKLPTFTKLMKEGAWGPLRSTIPPLTPPAWTSFMTGKNPGKHGVFSFYTQPPKGSHETGMISGKTIKARKIWDYFDGERVGLIDIPMTYPPEEINGCMISGWPVPSDDSIFTHPPELHTEIIREIGEYMIDRTLAGLGGGPVDMLRHLYSYTDMRRDAALYMLKNKGPFDFFMVVFRSTDFIQHEAFKFYDEEYASKHKELTRKFKCLIPQLYERIDTVMAEVIEAMGEDAITLVMSDHGLGPMKKRFYINRWLREEGFVVTKRGGIHMSKRPLEDFIARSPVSKVNRLLPQFLREVNVPYPRQNKKTALTHLVDWTKTTAFVIPPWKDGMVRVNLKGREPHGIVEPRDYERVVDDVIKRFLALTDPETGEKVFEAAYRRGEIYSGPYVDKAADIVVIAKDVSHIISSDLGEGPILEKPDNPAPAPHRMDGILLMHGEGIKAGEELGGLNITDIAPTVLYQMGRPIPESMDGKLMADGICDDYLKANPPVYCKEADGSEVQEGGDDFTDEEKESIKDGLKALGYMD